MEEDMIVQYYLESREIEKVERGNAEVNCSRNCFWTVRSLASLHCP
jgi:hypothetical protein